MPDYGTHEICHQNDYEKNNKQQNNQKLKISR